VSKNLVISIGRRCGSGGRKIGQMLAEKLGVKCYDKELMALAAKESGLCKELFEKNDEKSTGSFLYSLFMDTYSSGYSSPAYMDMPINQKIFLAQFESIKNLERRESCIIVGRCADYVLAGCPNVVTVFITGEDRERIKRLMECHDMDENDARELMIRIDKERSSYYNYYSNRHWGDSGNYDLCLDSSAIGLKSCVDLIEEFSRLKLDCSNKKR